MTHQWWRQLMLAVGGAALGALVVILVWLLITIYQVTGEIQDTQKSSRAILDYIEDCTEPTGKCYRASEARDAAQVGAFNTAVIAVRYCADQALPEEYTLRELTACVGKILEGKKGHQR